MAENANLLLKAGKLYTRNLVRGFRVHGERVVSENGVEWREWNPYQSKLGAALMKGLECNIREGDSILYLGAANGATPSFVSDLVGSRGIVYCIEFAPRSMRDLIRVCEARENMVPILADARKTRDYEEVGSVDCVFEDVADPEQGRIMVENSRFLAKGGLGLLAVKARCVDSTVEPALVYEQVEREVSQTFNVTRRLDLAPFEEDHEFLELEKK
ncbi:MAG: fibrillarin-like rRNA/tRNA 2'-O-methyltransferase [Candidatus Micrarchaeia archaeon]